MSWIKNNEWLKENADESVRWRYLRRFIVNYKPFAKRLSGAGVLALLGSVTAFLIPFIFRFVQQAVAARDVSLLAMLLLGFLGITVLEIATTYWIRNINARISTLLNRRLVLQYYGKILNLSIEEFIDFKKRSNLFQRIVDAMSITGQCTNILIRGGQLLIVVLIISAAVGTLSLTVLGVLALGTIGLFFHVLAQAKKLSNLRQRALAVNYPLVGKMTEVLSGLFTIKALAASIKVTSDISHLVNEKTSADYRELAAEVRSDQLAQVIRAVTLVGTIGTSIALMLAGYLVIADVFALYVLANLLLQPVSELAFLYQLLSRLSVNIQNFYEVLDLQDEEGEVAAAVAARRQRALAAVRTSERAINGAYASLNGHPSELSAGRPPLGTGVAPAADSRILVPSGNDLPGLSVRESAPASEPSGSSEQTGHIVFRKLGFAYRNGNEVISDVDLEILPGEKISLIGRSGVGKTTLLRLLLGFLQPQRGEIQVDGVDITKLRDKTAYRRRFGVVSQQDFLFGTSIRENLMFGLEEEIRDERLREALRMVGLWRDVERLPSELETSYSEDLFSGGQKQRFFIARALLRRPSIVLLDEPTSALDFESERQVMGALDLLVGNNTTITIAHRLSTVRCADRVVVLTDGRIRAVGTHQELYGHDDYYRSLCDYNSFVI
jgi:ABC-type multidrug transport system fused ATPase/permease subunit